MTGIILLDTVLILLLIWLAIVLGSLLYHAVDWEATFTVLFWLVAIGLAFWFFWRYVKFALLAMLLPFVAAYWLLIYAPIDAYVWLEEATGIGTGWWALSFYVALFLFLAFIRSWWRNRRGDNHIEIPPITEASLKELDDWADLRWRLNLARGVGKQLSDFRPTVFSCAPGIPGGPRAS